MTIVDLTGMIITELQTNAALAALVGSKVRTEWGQDESPPGVLIAKLGGGYSPFGQTRRARLQAPVYAARCYGSGSTIAAKVQAAQIANAVVEAMELRGPRYGTGGRLVHLSLVESAGDAVQEPETRYWFETVVFTAIGAQQAVS